MCPSFGEHWKHSLRTILDIISIVQLTQRCQYHQHLEASRKDVLKIAKIIYDPGTQVITISPSIIETRDRTFGVPQSRYVRLYTYVAVIKPGSFSQCQCGESATEEMSKVAPKFQIGLSLPTPYLNSGIHIMQLLFRNNLIPPQFPCIDNSSLGYPSNTTNPGFSTALSYLRLTA